MKTKNRNSRGNFKISGAALFVMNKVAPLFCRRQKNDNIFRAILNPNRWQARYLVLIAAGSCAKCGSDGREPKVHERKMDHAHKEVRPSAYISTHSLLYNTVLPPPFSQEQAGTSQIERQASSCGRRKSRWTSLCVLHG